LERRDVPSAAGPGAVAAVPAFLNPAASPGPAGFSPAQIRQAYGFNQVTFLTPGGPMTGDGRGERIAIVDAYSDPNIQQDLAAFDQHFGLPPPPSFTVVNRTGGPTLPAADPSWGLEISLDVEWAHAIAPEARILLVEAASANLTDLLAAVNCARQKSGVVTVSMSWGQAEALVAQSYPSQYGAFDAYFTTPPGHAGVTFVAASGDNTAAQAPEWPAVSVNVLGVGGTTLLTSDSSGTYNTELGW
jgi:subtilase family serine protease